MNDRILLADTPATPEVPFRYALVGTGIIQPRALSFSRDRNSSSKVDPVLNATGDSNEQLFPLSSH